MFRIFISILILVVVQISSFAQGKLITGTVTDDGGDFLPGASVIVKGTGKGTTTNNQGQYSLTVPAGNQTMVFSFVGMISKEIVVSNQSVIDVRLSYDDKMLDEVVAVGYGIVKKRDITGSVSSVNTKEMMQAIPNNISQGLQGRMAGVLVQKNDGAPGGGVNIQVRGANSFSSNTQPLYVIDGIPFTSGGGARNGIAGGGSDETQQNLNPLSFLNPQDIESVEVLKDASATAIYGSRGANGVVLITTKKGNSEGKHNIEFVSNFGVSQISKTIPMMNAFQYATYRNEGVKNALIYEGKTYQELPFPGVMDADTVWADPVTRLKIEKLTPFYNPSPEDYQKGFTNTLYNNIAVNNFTGTNWQDQIFQSAPSQDYSLSLNGFSKEGGYSVSGNFLNQDGVIVNSNFKRYTVRSNVYRTFKNFLTVGTNNNITKSENNSVPTSSGNGSGAGLQGIIRTALVYLPTLPVFDPSQNTEQNDQLSWLMANPYFYTRNMKNQLNQTNIFSSSFLEVKITESLKFRQNFGYNYSGGERGIYYGRFLSEGRAPKNGLAGKNNNEWSAITLESLLNFNKSFGDHAIGAVTGVTREKWNSTFLNLGASNFPDDLTGDYNFRRGDQSTYVIENGRSSGGLLSFLARANYGYKGKYLATASYRRDGTTAFAANHKYGNFFSGALAWRLSDEQFIQKLNFFDELKLRLGYGQTGNQSIGSYTTLDRLEPLNGVLNGSLVPGLVEGYRPGNPNLLWETTNQANAGIDMTILNNRLNFTLDVYAKKTIDLLTFEQTPPSSGFNEKTINSAFVTNKGIEASLGYKIFQPSSKYQWEISGNVSHNQNRIGGLGSDQYAANLYYNVREVFLRRDGQPIGVIYGYLTDGFYDNLAEVKADPSKASLTEASQRELIGEIKYKNLDDNNTVINEGDRTIIGNTNPRLIYGLNNTFKYGNWNASVFIQGIYGNDILNANLFDLHVGDIRNGLADAFTYRWTPENPSAAKFPKAWETQRRDRRISDRDIEDGSYARLKNVNIGYTFNNPIKGLDNINIYLNASNLWTWTNYSWYDPDVNGLGGNGGRNGVDFNSYPNARTYTLGFKLSL